MNDESLVFEIILITIAVFAAVIYLMLKFAKKSEDAECNSTDCSACGKKHSCSMGKSLLHGSPDEIDTSNKAEGK